MNFVGFISPVGEPPFSKEEWLAQIEEEPNLPPPQSRVVRNPATGETVLASPPPTSARLMKGEDEIGSLSWSQTDETYLIVLAAEGCEDDVVEFCNKIGKKIGGRFSQNDPKEG